MGLEFAMHDSALLVEDVNVGAQQTGVCRHEHGVAPKLRRQDINIACSTARVCRGLCRDEDTRSNDFGAAHRIVVPDVRVYSSKVPAPISKLIEGVYRSAVAERAVLPLFPTHIALARR
jgi:hypothetical protein